MEFVKGCALRLPPGFRFHPTDEELVLQYLRRKASACPLPAAIIPEIDLGKYDPWDLPGESKGEKYFFNVREAKYPNRFRSNRVTCSGYWKASGKDKRIVASGNQLVGLKKVLVFYQGKPPHGARTDWVMHEYRLAGTGTTAHDEDWVVCRIFMKNSSTEMKGEPRRRRAIEQVRDNGMSRQNSSAPSCLESSCITELSDDSHNGDEADSKGVVSSPYG